MSKKVELTEFSAEDVKNFRKINHLDQSDFAELLGVTKQAVIFWETNQRRIPETTVRTLLLFKKYPKLMNEF